MAAASLNSKPKTSLIISTYNWPEALNLCLQSVCSQSVLPDEVIIADDGSTIETFDMIEEMKRRFPVPLVHVWQEDDGFQLAKIRNKAIARASHEYIVQVDGDLILHENFIEDHLELSKPGTFIAGSRVIMSKELSEKLLFSKETRMGFFVSGMSNIMNRFWIKSLRNYFADHYKPHDIRKLRGCNMAFWRQDLIRVNGYNEDFFGWGREDNEIAARLINIGVYKRAMKFGGIVFHLYHPEKCRERCIENEQRLAQTVTNKIIYCNRGVNQYEYVTV
ncbi:glycosyltransferase family 2 protein [Dyadobacter sp. CY312]|uniref:glycosyltransferase family 2 protein n=1 Tax=Dyadobacter sp. CY312 TaxID=2907303 RepID=UPI001F24805D|nr:glycosyltransferase family 2 protein [Dyadobacter sp. CY312]MCE7040122.1 glycosyltransferase family 2 protein [Dyadobacter sp. CY312]